MKKYSLVLKELSSLVDKIDEKEFSTLVDSIITAGHVFLAGAGRSGQMINAFANRLIRQCGRGNQRSAFPQKRPDDRWFRLRRDPTPDQPGENC